MLCMHLLIYPMRWVALHPTLQMRRLKHREVE